MLSRFALTATAIWLFAACGCKQPQQTSTPSEFTSVDFKFKAKFPATPKQEEQIVKGVKQKLFIYETRDKVCGVAVSESPIPADTPDAKVQAWLDAARDISIRDAGGTHKSSSPITLAGKYPGREYTAELTQPAKGTLRARMYLVGTRLYQVSAMGAENYATTPEATAFLDSFQLLE